MTENAPKVFRGHGLGNDYLAVDGEGMFSDPTPAAIRLICDRHVGIGSDGLLVAVPSDHSDFRVRIFNPDGSEAEKSGNGLRVFAAYLFELGRIKQNRRFSVETLGGDVAMEIHGISPDGVMDVEVAMGRASFRSSDVGLEGPDREVDGEILELPGGDRVQITTVSVGNPHCVCFEDELVVEDLRRRGPQISTHEWFANGTNVQFARAVGPDEVEAFVWERGAGETMASGSSACAVAAAAVKRGLVQNHDVRVRMEGGTLLVNVGEDWNLILRAPVEATCFATPTSGFLSRLEELL